MKNQFFACLLMLACALLLSACGGGGGGGNDTTTCEITTNCGPGGSIDPTAATVDSGEFTSFTITIDNGYEIESVSGCGGTLSGTTYTTGSILSDCTVTATFRDTNIPPVTYDVNASSNTGGEITPSFTSVEAGNTTTFTVTPDNGFFIDGVTGCDGTLTDNTYTTGPITASCDVVATFAELGTPTVTAGDDQAVRENTNVTVGCTASDTDGTIEIYSWTQLSGTTVTINNADRALMNFDAPETDTTEILVFEIVVTDNDSLTASDTVTITVNNVSPTNVIAAIGMPAVGFSEEFIYWSVSMPSIGDSGHVAFTGVADVSISSTEQNTNALWTGLPNDLNLIIKENDTLPGLPGNVLFSTQGRTPPIVNPSGQVALHLGLKGAVTIFNDEVLAVHADDNLQIVIREGDQAPGFPPGYIIQGYGGVVFNQYVFSDAGLVFTTQVLNTVNNIYVTAMWYWNFNEFTLVAVIDGQDDVDLAEESPDIFADDCHMTLSPVTGTQITNSGEIAIQPWLANNSGQNCPNANTILKWDNGNYTAVVSDGDPVPGLAGYSFVINGVSSKFYLEEDGDISIFALIGNGVEYRALNWVVKDNGDHEYISIGGETLPDDASATINTNPPGTFAAPIVDDQGNYLISVMTTTNNEVCLLKGASRPLPYSSVDEIGTSPLSKVVRETDVPTGHPATAYFASIGHVAHQDAPTIDSSGNIAFSASRADATIPFEETQGIWHVSSTGGIKKLIEAGDEITVNGNTDIVNRIAYSRLTPSGNGNCLAHSNTGQIILPARFNSNFQAIVLLTP